MEVTRQHHLKAREYLRRHPIVTRHTALHLKASQFEMSADLAIANTAELEVTTDGRRWNRLERIENSDGWKTHGLDLSDYEGKTVQLRFSVNSRIGRAKNGISLSNLQVFGQADKE